MSTDKLHTIFDLQHKLQVESFGVDPMDMEEQDRVQYITWNILAATDELHEALAEVGWKPWATSKHVNESAFRGELVDVLHFFVNLCLAAGMNADELFERYTEKRARNEKRQAIGYDGVSGKCKECKRALDDVVAPVRIHFDEERTEYFCSMDHAMLWIQT